MQIDKGLKICQDIVLGVQLILTETKSFASLARTSQGAVWMSLELKVCYSDGR